jgi:hypothetical protein
MPDTGDDIMTKNPLKAIRAKCMDCSGDWKTGMWCPCDGVHSGWCDLWPYRFGMRPGTARKKYGAKLITPELMPDAGTSIDDLPFYGVKETEGGKDE